MTDLVKMGRNNQRRGAADERDVARILGGQRHKANAGGPGDDILHSALMIEIKGGQRVANNILRDAMANANAAAVNTTKQPCVVLVDRAGTRTRRYIVFELEPWAAENGWGA